jgi:hypothetical protein
MAFFLSESGSKQARQHAQLLDMPLVDQILPGLDKLRHGDWGPEQYEASAAITAAALNSRESDGKGGFYGHTFALTPTHVKNLALGRGWDVRKTIAQLKVLDSHVKSGLDRMASGGFNNGGQSNVAVAMGRMGGAEQARLHKMLLDMQLCDELLPRVDTLRRAKWSLKEYEASAAITAAANATRSTDGEGGFYGNTFAMTPTQVAHIAEVRDWTVRKTIAQLKVLDSHVKSGLDCMAGKGLNGKGQCIQAVEMGKSGIAACTGH